MGRGQHRVDGIVARFTSWVVAVSGHLLRLVQTGRIQAYAARHGLSVVDPALPAVTCTAQSDYLTGRRPETHGIVANGWFHRELAEVQFWKQSNHLVTAPKLFEVLKAQERRIRLQNPATTGPRSPPWGLLAKRYCA